MADILVGKKMLSKLSSSMSEVTSGSSETFGKKMLQKMGWSEGKGLGKSEQGVTSHVRVKKREEAVGLGADVRENIDYQWWYNVYNKAAAKMPGSSKKKKKGKKGKKPGSIPTVKSCSRHAEGRARARARLVQWQATAGRRCRCKSQFKAKYDEGESGKSESGDRRCHVDAVDGSPVPRRPRTRSTLEAQAVKTPSDSKEAKEEES